MRIRMCTIPIKVYTAAQILIEIGDRTDDQQPKPNDPNRGSPLQPLPSQGPGLGAGQQVHSL